MKIRIITREDIPCWYELSWQQNPPALILRIHRDFLNDFLNELKIDPRDMPIIKAFMKEFEFTEFGCDFGKDIGFNKTFRHRGEKDGFIVFAAEIPKIKKFTKEKCRRCEGSGKDMFGDECTSCDGGGRDYIIDWRDAEAISASLSFLTLVLLHCKKDTSAPFPQLLIVETITQRDLHGGSLYGEISIPLRRWLISVCGRDDFSEVISAMKIAHDKMFGLRDYDKFSFRVEVREQGGFIMDCPGNATGLHPTDWYMRDGEGYRFSCHNVDSFLQQITLLAGLAVLHDKARKGLQVKGGGISGS